MGARISRAFRSVPFARVLSLCSLVLFVLAGVSSAARAAEPVRLASLAWEPYIGPDLPEQGFVAALVRAAFADQKQAVEIQFLPWERALELAQRGEVDGLVPEYYSGRRETEFVFSAALVTGPLVFFKRRDVEIAYRYTPGPLDAGLRALTDKRFGVVRGYLNTPAFDAADYLTKLEYDDDLSNLRALVERQVDLAVIDRHVAEHLIRTRLPEHADALEPMLPRLGEPALYIAFARKSPRMAQARDAFNRGLERMRRDGRLDALRQRLLSPAPR